MNPVHNNADAAAAGASVVSCAIGFRLHEILGLAGQIIGVVSGALSIAWLAYQITQAVKRNRAAKP